MKEKNLKGFTLLELIIVLAIFSLLMLGAMSLIDPVSKIQNRATTNENSYAYVDNIQNYLQESLEFSDHIWVYQGNMSSSDLADKAMEFKEQYYKDIIWKASEPDAPDFAKCRIRVMTLINNKNTPDPTAATGVNFTKGQILMQTVDYMSDSTTTLPLSNPVKQLNETFFGDIYTFDYVLGATSFTNVTDSNGDNALAFDSLVNPPAGGVPASLNPSNFAVSIAAYQTKTDRNNHIFEDHTVSGPSGTYVDYRIYPVATHYFVANIPLFNVISRNNTGNSKYWIAETPGNNSVAKHKEDNSGFSAFRHGDADISMHADDNIYIVYAVSDEIASLK